MVRIWYASLTEVQRAADIPSTALYDARCSDVLDQATDAVRETCQRDFEPTLETRWFPWPQDLTQNPRMLRLGRSEILSITAITDGDGSTVDLSSVKPVKEGSGDFGGPYDAIINPNGWTSNSDVKERSVGVQALYCGMRPFEPIVTTTVSNLTGSTVDVADSANLGVGSLIRIGTERLVINRMGWLQSSNAATINLSDDETADNFTVTSGAAFHVGEVILIEAEQMLITDIVVNKLIVKRAFNGSTLVAHTGQTAVYVNRRLTVDRAVLGTSSTDTLSGANVLLWKYPGLVNQLCKAEFLNIINQDAASYGSRSGSGQGEMPMAVRGIGDLRTRAIGRYGRYRSGAV